MGVLKWPWGRTKFLRLLLVGGGSLEVEVWHACWTKDGNQLVSLTWTSVTGHRMEYIRLDSVGAMVVRPGVVRWRGISR